MITDELRAFHVRVTADREPRSTSKSRYLRLPASVRHVARLKAGDRLLLAACRSRSFLLAYPPAALDAMVLAYHLGAAL